MKSLLFFMLLSAAAKAASAQDVAEFDVAGIKLGIPMDDAIAAIKSKCQQEGATATVAPIATPNPYGSKYPSNISCRAGAANTIVHFVATPAGAIVVERVEYSMPSNPENEKAVTERALAKYGKPTYAEKNRFGGTMYGWCSKPAVPTNTGRTCETSPSKNLTVYMTSIKLSDPQYALAKEAERRSREIAKPAF